MKGKTLARIIGIDLLAAGIFASYDGIKRDFEYQENLKTPIIKSLTDEQKENALKAYQLGSESGQIRDSSLREKVKIYNELMTKEKIPEGADYYRLRYSRNPYEEVFGSFGALSGLIIFLGSLRKR